MRLSYTNTDLKGYMPNSSMYKNAFSIAGNVTSADKKLEAFTNLTYLNTRAKGRTETGYGDNNVMGFLQRNPDRQFSAQQIAESLPAPKISLSAIYRNLTALEGAGFINRFTKEGSREIYYQYIQSEHCRDCIHLICMHATAIFIILYLL